jgi:ribose/xylose/arabinose/galactoside ABC-type transport system permease subunit
MMARFNFADATHGESYLLVTILASVRGGGSASCSKASAPPTADGERRLGGYASRLRRYAP